MRKASGLKDTPVAYVAEMKIDGLSIALTYENGQMTVGAVSFEEMEKLIQPLIKS